MRVVDSRWFAFVILPLLVIARPFALAAGQDFSPFPPDLTRWVPVPGNPVFKGAGGDAWDAQIRERGYILVEGGTWHLWYTGYNPKLSPTHMLGHATSTDGLRWTRDPANPLVTTLWVEDMCVVKHGGRYIMFAESEHDIARQLTSRDGVHWTDEGRLDVRKVDGQPIEPGPNGTPTAWFENDRWYLLYERSDQGAWLAISPDRKVWTNVKDDPVLPLGPESYDRYAVAINQVIKRSGVYYAVYHATAYKPWRDWTTCIARSTDLVHWEKYPGNPLIGNNSSSGVTIDPDGPGPEPLRLYTMHPEVRVFRNP
jgi:sucrose-6-phosphate hydrolase SacC (GH32 family)